MSDDALLAETIDYVAIRRLQSAYADVVTRRAWDELRGIFLPEAVVEVDTRRGAVLRLEGPEGLGSFVAEAIARFDFFEFVILNTRIELGADRDAAVGRMYMCELRRDQDSGGWENAFGVYHDHYRRVDHTWWFEHRRYHSLARTGRDAGAFAFPHHLTLEGLSSEPSRPERGLR